MANMNTATELPLKKSELKTLMNNYFMKMQTQEVRYI